MSMRVNSAAPDARHAVPRLVLLLFLITPAVAVTAPLEIVRVNLSNAGAQADDLSAAAGITPDGRYVAFISRAMNLYEEAAAVGDPESPDFVTHAYLRDTCVGAPVNCLPSTVLVSRADDEPLEADATSFVSPVISANGRYVDFESTALAFGGELGHFLRDTCVNGGPACVPSTHQISILPGGLTIGGGGINTGFGASMSHDGRYVAFAADAFSNEGGVFLRDTCIGAPDDCVPSTVRVSTATDGGNANDENSGQPSISASGRYVAFASPATNLVPDDTNGAGDVFVRDTCIGGQDECEPSTVRVSVASDGSPGTGSGAVSPSISDTGRFVAFASYSTDLVENDTNQAIDIFHHDRDVSNNGVFDEPGDISTTRVSVADGTGDQAQPFGDSFLSGRPSISGNGRFVAFESRATNLTVEGSNGHVQVYVRDTCIGAGAACTPSTILVSSLPDGTLGNNQSDRAVISGDGQYVAFQSAADNLVANDTNGTVDILVARVFEGTTVVPVSWLPILQLLVD